MDLQSQKMYELLFQRIIEISQEPLKKEIQKLRNEFQSHCKESDVLIGEVKELLAANNKQKDELIAGLSLCCMLKWNSIRNHF